MNSIFNTTEIQALQERISQLTPDSNAQWGKMDAAQMCAHCSSVLDVNAGVIEEKKPSIMVKLMKPMIRKVVFGEKPYPKNSPTSPQFKVTDQKDFETEKANLLDRLHYFTASENRDRVVNHPSKVFGKLSEQQKGWSQYKHLHHHLEQFGV